MPDFPSQRVTTSICSRFLAEVVVQVTQRPCCRIPMALVPHSQQRMTRAIQLAINHSLPCYRCVDRLRFEESSAIPGGLFLSLQNAAYIFSVHKLLDGRQA
jgi:hypothetical protein